MCLALVAVVVVRPSAPGGAASQDDDAPTLVIVGNGMSAEIGGAHAKTDQMLYHTLQMFRAGATGLHPTSVRFEEGIVNFTASLPTVDNGRVTGSRREELAYPVDEGDRASLSDAARLVAGEVSDHRKAIVAMDMNLGGLDVVAGKGVGSVAALAADAARNTVPGADLAYEMALSATGEPVVPHDFLPLVDDVQTKWNRETAKAALFIEETARQFKAKHGPNARVILVGHSAFTDAIDQVPLKVGSMQLIDLRVLSSERVRPPRERDADRTVFIAHTNDLPPTRMGNALSPMLQGDLKNDGTVITLTGYSYVGWDDRPLVLLANAAKDVSPTARLVAALADEGKQLAAHTATHLYMSTFDMQVCRGDTCVGHRGTPADIVRLQAQAVFSGSSTRAVTRAVTTTLKQEQPKESHVGGISLTKPARLPVRASQVAALDIDPASSRLVLRLRSGETLKLPRVDDGTLAAAFRCVYGEGRGPELSLEGRQLDGNVVMAIGYVCKELEHTPLATLMIEADRALGSVAWGTDTAYQRPAIEHYQPFAELALDDRRVDEGALGGRVWMVPSAVQVTRAGDELRPAAVTLAVRFEFWDAARSADYLQGADIGIHTPAGDYLGAVLTRALADRADSFPEIQALRDPVVIVGALLWARAAGVAPSAELTAFADGALSEARAGYSLPEPVEEVATPNGPVAVLPVAARRTVEVAALARPAVVFGPDGPTRYLWEDGGESRIGYEQGRVSTLTSRSGRVSSVLYDGAGDLQAIVGSDGIGVVVLPSSDLPLLAAALVDAGTRVARIPHDALVVAEPSPRGFLDGRMARWLASERANRTGPEWLGAAFGVTAVAAQPSSGWRTLRTIIAAFGAALLLLLTWKRRAVRTYVWRRRVRTATDTAQLEAVTHLAAVGGPVAAETITEHLPAMSTHQARRVFERLANSGAPTAREVLLGQLGDSGLGPDAVHALDGMDPSWRAAPDVVALASRLSVQAASAEKSSKKERAIVALGRLRAAAAVPAVLAALGDRDLIWAAQRALTEIGRPAITPLLELLAEQGDERRDAAWRAVTGIADWNTTPEARAALPTLLAGLGHRYSLIRERCVMALGRIGDSRAYHPLIGALDDIKDRVRVAAVDALGDLGDQRAVPELKQRADDGSLGAVDALARLGETTPDVIARVLDAGLPSALQTLGQLASMDDKIQLDPAVLRALLATLISSDDGRRTKAYEVLLSLPGRWRTEPVTSEFAARLLDDKTEHPLAFGALVQIGEPIVPALVHKLEHGESPLAVKVLLDLKARGALPAFRRRITDSWQPQAGDMMLLMAACRDVESLDALLDATKVDKHCSDAAAAIAVIVEHRARDVPEAVLRRAAALEDRDWLEYIPYTGPCNFEGETHQHRLDCGRVRQLARQELVRRGVRV